MKYVVECFSLYSCTETVIVNKLFEESEPQNKMTNT